MLDYSIIIEADNSCCLTVLQSLLVLLWRGAVVAFTDAEGDAVFILIDISRLLLN